MPKQSMTIPVCQDCLLILANGCDDCGHGFPHDCHALNMSDSEITTGCADEDCARCADGGAWFSWTQACECCGSSLAGDRFCATLWWSEPAVPGVDFTHDTVPAMAHADYPHPHGYLIDCAACESSCHCAPDSAECVWSGHDSDAPDDDTRGAGQGADTRAVLIPRGTRHLGSDEVWAMLAEREGQAEITDECAAAIASWWQAPRGPGATLAALASGCPVTVSDVLSAVSYELSQLAYGAVADRDRVALGMLATWAINHPARWAVTA